MDKSTSGHLMRTSSSSSSSSSSAAGPSSPKRPAGRTKFQETRHPVFRGVRRRGRAGRWVCEVRVPGSRGDRLWVGTFDTADEAARAHDAAMLALCGESASLNFPDSAWLLHVPPASGGAQGQLPDVQRAASEAVAEFLRRGAQGRAAASSAPPSEPASSAPPSSSPVTSAPTVVTGAASAAATLDNGMLNGDMFGDMRADLYYASLAQGLLMEPPPPPAGVECCDDEGSGGAEMELWS
ncbi:dehydration-responsive element-binding protein 1J-like [Oryza brachyantha]|uniref:dehydration-responsive element-binding protein 1J-like n=1 Tax=Oryza brachyantha TaxID=4533 RepID=UPI001ADB826A|nr:dehydration-responsive element-binding protein 1J-like [Oryza brachyantha]